VNAGVRLAAFGVVLAGALGAGALAGNVVGPISAGEEHSESSEPMSSHGDAGVGADHETDGADGSHGAAGGVVALDGAATTATVDGYEVGLAGTMTHDGGTEVRLDVRRDGRPVTDLSAYPDGYGHLTALGVDDLAPAHVQVLDGDAGGPEVAFALHAPAPGDYRLLFEFAHAGAVHTVQFTVAVTGGHGA
jgi:hypothetical protein